MERLRGLGVNTIGILMEGRMRSLQDPQIQLPDRNTLQEVEDALRDANGLGFATVLTPHLYLDDGQWRGQIRFEDSAKQEAWWDSYAAFIEQAARLAARSGTSVLSIGVELKALSSLPDSRARMEKLAARVRQLFRGQLTYNANWDEAEQVIFWDQVDLVGVNGYYPLEPDPFRGAQSVARRMGALSQKHRKPVLVLEVGYRSSPLSHKRPWEWPDHIEPNIDDASQANAWAAILTHWMNSPGIKGLLIWVIPTDPDDPASEPRHGFNPLNKPAERVIQRAFSSASGVAIAP